MFAQFVLKIQVNLVTAVYEEHQVTVNLVVLGLEDQKDQEENLTAEKKEIVRCDCKDE